MAETTDPNPPIATDNIDIKEIGQSVVADNLKTIANMSAYLTGQTMANIANVFNLSNQSVANTMALAMQTAQNVNGLLTENNTSHSNRMAVQAEAMNSFAIRKQTELDPTQARAQVEALTGDEPAHQAMVSGMAGGQAFAHLSTSIATMQQQFNANTIQLEALIASVVSLTGAVVKAMGNVPPVTP